MHTYIYISICVYVSALVCLCGWTKVGRSGDKQHGGSSEFVQFNKVEDVKWCFGRTIVTLVVELCMNLIIPFFFAVINYYLCMTTRMKIAFNVSLYVNLCYNCFKSVYLDIDSYIEPL